MSFLNFLQPRSFIKVIIFLSWLLICIGTPVFSEYRSPYYIPFEGEDGCQPDVCGDQCNNLGFPEIDASQGVLEMSHDCVDEPYCYCSKQSSEAGADTLPAGKVIQFYTCGHNKSVKKVASIVKCMEYCGESEDDTAPILNLFFKNGDCCCGAEAQFTVWVPPKKNSEGDREDDTGND